MPRFKILNDVNKIKKTVSEYKNDPKPTLAGLCIALDCIPNTLYNAMAREDEIAEVLEDAYNYLIYAHEKALWEKNPVSHIFYLKCIKRFGYQWKENDNIEPEKMKDTKITFEIKEKK